MALDCIDALVLNMAKDARKKEHADVNDTSETLERLKELRPGLYYNRDKYRAKWSTTKGCDYASILRKLGRLPKIEGVQVVAR